MIQAMLGDLFQWSACQAFRKNDGCYCHQPADGCGVMGHRTAFMSRPALVQVGKKTAVIRLSIGVWMLRRLGRHKFDVGVEEFIAMIVTAVPRQHAKHCAAAIGIQRILPCRHAVVIMLIRFSPKFFAALEYDISDDLPLSVGSSTSASAPFTGGVQRHNGRRVIIGRGFELGNAARKLAENVHWVVVPVDRHRQGVADECRF